MYRPRDSQGVESIIENGIEYKLAYDSTGLLSAIANQDTSLTFSRNEHGRVIGVQYPDGSESLYEYDELGNRDRVAFSNGAADDDAT